MSNCYNRVQQPLKRMTTINDEALGEDTDPSYELQYIDIGNLDSSGRIHAIANYRFENAPSRARRIVRHGDVIISTVRTYLQAIAAIESPPDNLIVSTGFAVVRPRPGEWDTAYCKYALREPGFIHEVVNRSVGVSYPAINASELGDIPICVPALSEQRVIADYLDRETAKIDTLIAAKQRLLDLLAEKRRALITDAVTRGLDSNVPLRDSGVEWLGEIPSHWATPPVYTRFEVQLGKMLDEKRIRSTHLAPYLRNVDVQWGYVNIHNLQEMDFDEADRRKYALRYGDILVCEGGELGRSAIWREELNNCYFQKAILRLRPTTQKDIPEFFVYVMYMLVKMEVFSLQATNATIQHLPAETLRRMRYAAPPFSEQRAIVHYLDQKVRKLDALIAVTNNTIELLHERRTALIAAAVTGEL